MKITKLFVVVFVASMFQASALFGMWDGAKKVLAKCSNKVLPYVSKVFTKDVLKVGGGLVAGGMAVSVGGVIKRYISVEHKIHPKEGKEALDIYKKYEKKGVEQVLNMMLPLFEGNSIPKEWKAKVPEVVEEYNNDSKEWNVFLFKMAKELGLFDTKKSNGYDGQNLKKEAKNFKKKGSDRWDPVKMLNAFITIKESKELMASLSNDKDKLISNKNAAIETLNGLLKKNTDCSKKSKNKIAKLEEKFYKLKEDKEALAQSLSDRINSVKSEVKLVTTKVDVLEEKKKKTAEEDSLFDISSGDDDDTSDSDSDDDDNESEGNGEDIKKLVTKTI